MNNTIPSFKSNIEAGLAKFPKAAKKRIAIENVTYGVRSKDCDTAWHMNFSADAAAYSWPQVVVNCMKWIIKENDKVPVETTASNDDAVSPEFPYGVAYTTGTC